MLVEKTNVGIRRLEGIVVALIETAGSRDKEEDMEELAENAVFIAIVEEGCGGKEYGEINAHERPQPRSHLIEIDYHKHEASRRPQEEMTEDVHHGIECHRRYGARSADILGEFHDAIRSAAKAKGSNIAETEAADSQLQGIAEDKVLIVVRCIDQHLKSTGIKQIDEEPYSYHAREIEHYVQTVFLHRFPAIGERDNHDHQSDYAEEQKNIAV